MWPTLPSLFSTGSCVAAEERLDTGAIRLFNPDLTWDELLSRKELGAALKRSDRYIVAMKQRGFQMPGGRATINHALRFLSRVPNPCRRRT